MVSAAVQRTNVRPQIEVYIDYSSAQAHPYPSSEPAAMPQVSYLRPELSAGLASTFIFRSGQLTGGEWVSRCRQTSGFPL